MQSKSSPLLYLVLVGLTGYYGFMLYTKQVPCVTPITYALTAYDERFVLSRAEIGADVAKAAAVWNRALGRTVLFVATTTPELPVLFVYEDLQKSIDTVDSIDSRIATEKIKLDSLVAEYDVLKKKFDQAVQEHRETQSMVDELNRAAAAHNALIEKINADIKKANGASPQGESEEGLYIRDKDGTRIYIYGFQDKAELMSVLVHEFGHSLGLEHVDDPNAVMYRTDKSKSSALGAADYAELTRVCEAAQHSFLGQLHKYADPIVKLLPIAK